MLKFANVSVSGEVGQYRASEEQCAWRGSSGETIGFGLRSIRQAEWLDGLLRILYADTDGQNLVLGLSGFAEEDFDVLSQHLHRYAGVSLKRRQAGQSLPTLLQTPVSGHTCEPLTGTATAAAGVLDQDSASGPPPSPIAAAATPLPHDSGNPQQNPQRGAFPSNTPGRDADSSDDDGDAVSGFSARGAAPHGGVAPHHQNQSRPIPSNIRHHIADAIGQIPPVGAPAANCGSAHAYRDSLLEAWVWKESQWIKRWRARYLVLRPGGLVSYKRPGDLTPSETFDNVSRVISATDPAPERGFTIVTNDHRGVHHTCNIIAETSAARDALVSTINANLGS